MKKKVLVNDSGRRARISPHSQDAEAARRGEHRHQCSNKGRDARSCNGGGCEC